MRPSLLSSSLKQCLGTFLQHKGIARTLPLVGAIIAQKVAKPSIRWPIPLAGWQGKTLAFWVLIGLISPVCGAWRMMKFRLFVFVTSFLTAVSLKAEIQT